MSSWVSSVAGGVPSGVPSAVVKNADPSGVRDSSAAFIAAADSLPFGGVVSVPPGKYVVESLPLRDGLYWVGAGMGKTDGSTGTYLTLPASPSASMFIWDGEVDGYGGGVSHCYLYGGNTTTYDCIDLSAATTGLHRVLIEHNMIRGFRRGYYGSADDRSVLIQFNNFWNCVAGVYIPNNHPQFTGWNDYRDCTYGIQGKLYDAKVVGQNFAYCTNGVAPIDTSNRCERTQFTGCSFAFITNDGLVAGQHCTITGCMFLTKAENSVSGIRIIGNQVAVTGCQFDADGGIFTEGCIYLDTEFLGQVLIGANISGNTFRVEGTDVLYHLCNTNGRDLSSISFTNNIIHNCYSMLRRSGNSWGAVLYSNFSHNTFRYESGTMAKTLTGTITFTNGSATVTGVNSLFLSELRIGDLIRLSTDADTTAGWRRVQGITSDTSLTLTAVYGATGGAGTGYATRDVIHITNNGTVGNAICGNVIAIYSGSPIKAAYGIGGALGQSTVVGNYTRRGLGVVDTASSTSAQIANNVAQS